MKVKEYPLPNNRTLEIHTDDHANSPRTEFDNVGVMACWHRRINLGDKQIKMADFNSADEVRKHIESENDVAVILPLYLYDHSGLTMNTTGFSCPWDSGQVGWIYCTKQQVQDEWNGDIQKAKNYLLGEVETYNQYLQGDIYGFIIREAPCEECQAKRGVEEAAWGFYGDDPLENGMFDALSKEDRKALTLALT